MCTHCGKKWHTAKTCRTRARAERALANHAAASTDQQQPSDAAQCYAVQHQQVGVDAAMVSKLKAANGTNLPTDWIVDLGATAFMCCNRELFTHLEPSQSETLITMPDGNSVSSTFIGQVQLTVYVDQTRPREMITLIHVHYVPDLGVNLLSVPQLLPHWCHRHAVTTPTAWQLRSDAGRLLISAERQGQLYYLPTVPSNSAATVTAVAANKTVRFDYQAEQFKEATASTTANGKQANATSSNRTTSVNDEGLQTDSLPPTGQRLPINVPLWHRRLGHLNMAAVRELYAKDMVTGMNVGMAEEASQDDYFEYRS